MVIFKENPEILNKISQFKVNNSTKILLKHKDVNNQDIEVVIKKSETKKGQFLLAVFIKVGKGWLCKEAGYQSDLKVIERHLIRKYFPRESGDVNVS